MESMITTTTSFVASAWPDPVRQNVINQDVLG